MLRSGSDAQKAVADFPTALGPTTKTVLLISSGPQQRPPRRSASAVRAARESLSGTTASALQPVIGDNDGSIGRSLTSFSPVVVTTNRGVAHPRCNSSHVS